MSKHNIKTKRHSNNSNGLNNAASSNQEIELLAYQIYEEKGGTDLDNWLEAERMLKEQHAISEY